MPTFEIPIQATVLRALGTMQHSYGRVVDGEATHDIAAKHLELREGMRVTLYCEDGDDMLLLVDAVIVRDARGFAARPDGDTYRTERGLGPHSDGAALATEPPTKSESAIERGTCS